MNQEIVVLDTKRKAVVFALDTWAGIVDKSDFPPAEILIIGLILGIRHPEWALAFLQLVHDSEAELIARNQSMDALIKLCPVAVHLDQYKEAEDDKASPPSD